MTSSLANRLEEIPGVASVVIDLEGFGRGIDVRLEEGADEVAVMERLRALLAAYGVRHDREPSVAPRRELQTTGAHAGVQISITPMKSGARIEAATKSVKSFRVVAATPLAVAQGLADAWCQVIGRVPIEIVSVTVGEDRQLVVKAVDGEHEAVGGADIDQGWVDALSRAVAGVLGDDPASDVRRAAS
ncbi:MAG TPA: hypothetical protein VJ948_06840 [Acidimicrobiia bacterium]|nr:hypothetical protein [Acidimicrobiia bacterium]